MKPSRPIAGAVLGLACMALSAPASAVTPEERALAEGLFREGKRLLAEGQLALACPKIEESQRLDPGAGTLLNLALCHQGEGRTATAWAELKEALAQARSDGRADREQIAREHLATIEPELSRLTVGVAPEAKVTGLEVKRDGISLREAVWGAALPVDPGEHVVEATAPGKKPWKLTLRVGPDGDLQQVTVPLLADEPRAVAPKLAPPASAVPPPATVPPEPVDAAFDPRRVAGLTVGGLGLAALGVGGFFGVRAIALRSESDDHCPTDTSCDAKGVALNDDAQVSATLANVGIGAGLVALGLGAYLVISSGSGGEPPVKPARARSGFDLRLSPLGRSGGAAIARGRW
ncbi:MAG: hypothetical protein HY744_09050 [Deltaproteobacteria bacterium]|nr:hypothetical protein [Deltaproteobacteria bacterium]